MSSPAFVHAPPPPRPMPAPELAPMPSRPHPHPHPDGVLPSLQSLVVVLIAALFVITFILQPIRIPSSSMEPTLLVGDFLLMNKQIAGGFLLPPATIQRGDIVVFHDPVDDPNVHLVKRVIAIPGDRIHLRDGIVYRNGEPLKESYAIYRQAAANGFRDDFPDLQAMDTLVNPNWWIHLRNNVHNGEVTVPPASYFVMGDNRNRSDDSRYWGFVPAATIVGKPLMVYFSLRQPGFDQPELIPTAGALGAAAALPAAGTFARWDRTFHVVR